MPHAHASGFPSPSLALRKKRLLFSSGPKGPKTPSLDDGQRGGQAPALRENQNPRSLLRARNRDREISPTGETASFGLSRNHFYNNEL